MVLSLKTPSDSAKHRQSKNSQVQNKVILQSVDLVQYPLRTRTGVADVSISVVDLVDFVLNQLLHMMSFGLHLWICVDARYSKAAYTRSCTL